MEEIIKQSTDLYYEIDDCITTMLKARLDKDVDKEHESFFKMGSLMVETMQHISWLVGELKGNSQINWQTGEPKEEGEYLVTTLDGIVDYDVVYINSKGNMPFGNFDNVLAWCKLAEIEPYKEK
jgi:hypothetical protein